jgi:hypothetical protein
MFLVDEESRGYTIQVNTLSETDWSIERSKCEKLKMLTIPSPPTSSKPPSMHAQPTILHSSTCCRRIEIVDSLNRVHVHAGPVSESPILTLIPTSKFKVLKVACAPRHTLVSTSAGVVLSRGCISKGRMGVHDPNVKISSSDPIDWEKTQFVEIVSPSIRHAFIVDVFASGANSIGLTDRGKLFSWGDYEFQLLGYPSNHHCIFEPRLIGGLGEVKVCQVSLGAYHALAVSDSGNVYAWGHLPRSQQRSQGDSKSNSLRRRSPQTTVKRNDSPDEPQSNQSTTPVTHPTLIEFFATNGMAIGGAWAARSSNDNESDPALSTTSPPPSFLSHSLFATSQAVVSKVRSGEERRTGGAKGRPYTIIAQ